jgi:hypothetical protein
MSFQTLIQFIVRTPAVENWIVGKKLPDVLSAHTEMLVLEMANGLINSSHVYFGRRETEVDRFINESDAWIHSCQLSKVHVNEKAGVRMGRDSFAFLQVWFIPAFFRKKWIMAEWL